MFFHSHVCTKFPEIERSLVPKSFVVAHLSQARWQTENLNKFVILLQFSSIFIQIDGKYSFGGIY